MLTLLTQTCTVQPQLLISIFNWGMRLKKPCVTVKQAQTLTYISLLFFHRLLAPSKWMWNLTVHPAHAYAHDFILLWNHMCYILFHVLSNGPTSPLYHEPSTMGPWYIHLQTLVYCSRAYPSNHLWAILPSPPGIAVACNFQRLCRFLNHTIIVRWAQSC